MKSTDGEEMNHDPVSRAPSEVVAAQRDAKHSTRRRKLLGGVAASPLLLSISSRPAWANGGMCTPSALASANLSGQHDFSGCSISAGWWKNNESRWPIAASTYFHSIFEKVAFNGSVIYETTTLGAPTTLSDVMNKRFTGDNPGNLAFPLIGAYLNALQFPYNGGAPGYPFAAADIVKAFNELHQPVTLRGKGKPKPNQSAFENLKNTLDSANNLYDSNTAKPGT
ncbi:hypothetical protein [Thauera sp. WH-1]|uniref:hypothetical protein n=1 Tax=Thauera sp. WH-1 TaxID=3398230 RepID=UPI0039FDCD4D